MTGVDYRLLLTGSRAWDDTVRFRWEMDRAEAEAVASGAGRLVVVHGACYPAPVRPSGVRPYRSADWLAHLWVEELPHRLPVVDEPHPAAWTAPCRSSCRPGHRRERRSGSICPSAGAYRNQLMVDLGADAGIAFRVNGSRGTGDCIGRMRHAGIPCRRIEIASPIHTS